MFAPLRGILKNGLASPQVVALVPVAVFLAAWLYPPNTYALTMQEPDRIFLDPFSFILFFLCVAAFFLGLRTYRFFSPSSWNCPVPAARSTSPLFHIGLPIMAGCALCTGTLLVYGARINFLELLLSQQGETIKQMNNSGLGQLGFWSQGPIFLTGIIWWSCYRIFQLKLDREMRRLLLLACFLGCCLSTYTAIAMISRQTLLSLPVGITVAYLYVRESSGELQLGAALRRVMVVGVLLSGLFMLASVLRGAAASNLLTRSVMGYSIASYNRFASVLHGQLHYVYAGTGYYLFFYLRQADTLNNIFHYREALNWPTFYEAFITEFMSISQAGLNTAYNWCGVFGYLFADIGWGALLYMYGAGMMVGYFWKRFKLGSPVGILCYPSVAIWILFWNGGNALFDFDLVHLFIYGLLLGFWDKFFFATTPLVTRSPRMDVEQLGRPTPSY